MEIRSFAERVLYGTTLDDKLLDPGVFTDDERGGAVAVPSAPGRPVELLLEGEAPRHRVPFPGLHELDDPRKRGHVLHFFANHELLALELMALALLRFPEAPASFRRGLVETMLEEQKHMRLYRERMEAAGVAFGEIPVNAFFWRALRDMRSPLEFVAGMSLTFEQANLDYAGYYARAFRTIGDLETADALDVVYEEEIGHVKHGAVWFDRWRPRERDAFRAWQIVLPEAISPARARGLEFDEEARLRAGLEPRYVERLRLFRASRGRPPVVHVMNPDVEHELRLGGAWQPPAHVIAMTEDLAIWPGFAAAEDDVVLVPELPREAYLAQLDQAGFTFPEFVVSPPGAVVDEATFPHRHVSGLRPWGWSPVVSRRIAPLASRLVGGPAAWTRAVVQATHGEGVRLLHGQQQQAEQGSGGREDGVPARRVRWAVDKVDVARARASWIDAVADPRLAGPDVLGGVAASRGEIDVLMSESDAAATFVVKAPLGAAGRNAVRIRRGAVTAEQERQLDRMLREHGALVVEPWLDRVLDFSCHLTIQTDGVVHDGMIRTECDARGQFSGAVLHRFSDGLSDELVRFIYADGKDSRWLRRRMTAVADRAAAWLREEGYEGPVGLDGFIYRRADGSLAVQPVCEVNARMTMGRVALALESRVHRRRVGLWTLVRVRDLVARHGSMEAFARYLEERHPVSLHRDRGSVLLDGGVVATNDPITAKAVVGLLAVGSTLQSCRDAVSGSSSPG